MNSMTSRTSLTFNKIYDLVERCQCIHRGIAAILARRAEDCRDDRERYLLLTLVKTETELAESLKAVVEGAADGPGSERLFADGWIQSAPASVVREVERTCRELPAMDFLDLETQARVASRKLTRFFEELVERTPESSSLRQTLESLHQLEGSSDRQHSRTASSHLV